jgi:hypothetical protein
VERELQMIQFSATRCSCIAIFGVSLMSFAAITLCVASQRMFVVVVYFVINSVRKLLDTPSYTPKELQSLYISMPNLLFFFGIRCLEPPLLRRVQLPQQHLSVILDGMPRHISNSSIQRAFSISTDDHNSPPLCHRGSSPQQNVEILKRVGFDSFFWKRNTFICTPVALQ